MARLLALVALATALAAAVATTAPAAPGTMLVYTGNTPVNQGYASLGSASGNTVQELSVLPSDLTPYRCVVLPVNQDPFSSGQLAALSAYVAGGGRVLALADYYFYAGAITAMNGLAGALGADMSVVPDLLDPGFNTTTNIDATPYTVGVTSIRDAAASSVSLVPGGSALSLIRSVDGVTIVAAEQVGTGLLVLAGDSNVFSDASDTGYTTEDNGVLAANLCGSAGNDPPVVDAGGPYAGSEGASVALSSATASDPNGDPLTHLWSYTIDAGVDAGATCTPADPTALNGTIACTDDGAYTMTLMSSDGSASASDDAALTIANVPPSVAVTAPANGSSHQVGAAVPLAATIGDPGSNDTHTCSVAWGDGTTTPGVVAAGACTGSHAFSAPGGYVIQATVADDDGGQGVDSVSVTVAGASSGGLVTGGGWLRSPAGAGNGKVTFGFVVKGRNSSPPVGHATLWFHALDLKLSTSHYDSLEVSADGCQASFGGTGRVKGMGSLTFTIWAYEGRCEPGHQPDRLRIKLMNGGSVVYDNGAAYPDGQPLGGGSIVIHVLR